MSYKTKLTYKIAAVFLLLAFFAPQASAFFDDDDGSFGQFVQGVGSMIDSVDFGFLDFSSWSQALPSIASSGGPSYYHDYGYGPSRGHGYGYLERNNYFWFPNWGASHAYSSGSQRVYDSGSGSSSVSSCACASCFEVRAWEWTFCLFPAPLQNWFDLVFKILIGVYVLFFLVDAGRACAGRRKRWVLLKRWRPIMGLAFAVGFVPAVAYWGVITTLALTAYVGGTVAILAGFFFVAYGGFALSRRNRIYPDHAGKMA